LLVSRDVLVPVVDSSDHGKHDGRLHRPRALGMQFGAILAPTPAVVDEQLCKALQPFAACYDETEWNQLVVIRRSQRRKSHQGKLVVRWARLAEVLGTHREARDEQAQRVGSGGIFDRTARSLDKVASR